MGLQARFASLPPAVLSTLVGPQELQLSGSEHEEREHRLLCNAADARVLPYRQSGC